MKVSLLSMMLGLMPIAMTSCKDYDDDITTINETTGSLDAQIKALQAAIEANKQAAQAAHDAADAALKAAQEAAEKGDQAEADAQKAMAMAKAAEEAAAQAKAEALAEIIKQCQALQAQIDANKGDINSNKEAIEALNNQLSALVGRIEGVEKGLGSIDLDSLNNAIIELNTALEAVNVQLEALKAYENRISELENQYSGLSSEVAAAKSSIESVRNDLTALQTKVNGLVSQVEANANSISSLTSQIGELRSELSQVSQKISEAVANGINTIAGVISERLTSVTLMPDLYVGGIPTIEFKSAQYNALVWNAQQKAWVEGSTSYVVSNNETEVEYRLNPGSVRTQDIDASKLAFVSRIATTRAGEVENDIINVVSGEVSTDGILKIKAGKSNTASLNLSGNKIYTVSLKVPIAKQHLFDNETSANVYSEYTRLSEVYFTPKLHKTAKVANGINVHFNDSTSMYQSAMNSTVAAKVQYNQTLDLNTLVQGCEFTAPDTHVLVSQADFAKYGFEVSYSIATAPYVVSSTDKANQQEFVQLNGSTFTPGAPSTNGFAAGNQAAIGKQPIIHVWLVDKKNNKVVDQRYFKVLITREDPTPLSYTITPNKTANLGCSNYTFNVTWDEMTKQVLTQFPTSGISKEDFYSRYGAHATSVEVKKNGVLVPSLANNVTDNVTLDNTGASVPVMSFTIDNTEIGKLEQGKSATYTITLTYTDPKDLNPSVSITFTCVITNNIANPALGKTDATKWVNEQMLLYPIPYGSANAQAKAEYNTNILEGRFSPLVTGLLNCGEWDMLFAQTYNGATMTYPSGYSGWKTVAQASSLNNVYVAITHNAAGIALVEGEKTLNLNWLTNLNGISLNSKTFATSKLKIVKPLQNPGIDNSTVLSDQSFAQKVDLNDKFTLKDAFGNVVANTSGMAKNLWNYYGVESVTFAGTAGAIYVTDDVNGTNPRTLASLHMTADINVTTNELTYTNEGAPLQNDCYLQIPVQIKHYWGTLTGKVYIKIKHVL